MPNFKNRAPMFFTDTSHIKATGPRFQGLSKADWADAFCDLYRQVFGEDASPEDMMADAERRTSILKRCRGI